jgi:hypothetical protein
LEVGAAATILQRLDGAMQKMLELHRFTLHRFTLRLLSLGAVVSLLSVGCTLITDVDRSKIPEPPVIEPDPLPAPDGGAPDAGMETQAGDAGGVPDAAAPDAAGEPELDAAVPDAAAQADGG